MSRKTGHEVVFDHSENECALIMFIQIAIRLQQSISKGKTYSDILLRKIVGNIGSKSLLLSISFKKFMHFSSSFKFTDVVFQKLKETFTTNLEKWKEILLLQKIVF